MHPPLKYHCYHSLQGFRKSFTEQLGGWKSYYDDKEPHKAAIPAPWGEKLTDFQKMIVLRCLRPDKVSTALCLCVQ